MSADLKTEAKRKEYEQVFLAGGAARRARTPTTQNPYRNKTTLRGLYDQWLLGWQDADVTAKGAR